MATTYRLSVGYVDLAEKETSISYSGVKAGIDQAAVTAITTALWRHGDDILQGGLQDIKSAELVQTEVTKTEFTPAEDPGE